MRVADDRTAEEIIGDDDVGTGDDFAVTDMAVVR